VLSFLSKGSFCRWRLFVTLFFCVFCQSGFADGPSANEFTPQNVPSNDSFSDPLSIDSSPYSFEGNILWATIEPDEPMGKYAGASSRTLWWSFKATEPGVLSLWAGSSNPGTLPWYPTVVIFRGTNLNSLEYLTESPLTSVSVVPGEEYRIQVQGIANGGVPGDFGLQATFDLKPTNDMFADAVALEGNSASTRTWIMSPTIEVGEPLVTPDMGGTLWWSWTAPSDGRIELNPAGDPTLRTVANLAVYTGTAVDQLTAVVTNAPFTIKAKQGVTYRMQVYPHATNTLEYTGFDLAFFPFSPATNDNFVDAAPLDGSPKSNAGATREPGEPLHAAGGPNKSLWWKFTAGENRSAAIRISQTTVTNVTIAVYQGGSVDTLRLVNKGSDRVIFDTWAGETYYIAAETAETDTGDITIYLMAGLPTTISRPIPGNLVANPSFEDTANPIWSFTDVGGAINEVAPDGRNYVTTWTGNFYQDIPTTPGEQYRLRFVYAPAALNQDALIVKLGGSEVGRVAAAAGGWQTADFVVTATAATSRLEFTGTGIGSSMDQISLVPLNDPPVIMTQPTSATAFRGAPVLFHAGITGADPMARQWYFNDQPIPGATDVSLKFATVSATNVGTYYIVATNAYGRAESDHVTLSVEGSSHVQIVLQPQGDSIITGQYFVLQTAAVGDPPLAYQWSRNDVDIASATNSSLIFSAFAPEQAGSYVVRVSNGIETVTSLAATLNSAATNANGGGLVWFANAWGDLPTQQTAPVFDIDGLTKLNGADFVAQLYAGQTADILRPVASPIPFGNRGTGTWTGRTIALPNIAPGADAFVQVRVWQLSAGASYESARALGGKFGRSEVMHVVPMGKLFPPPVPEGTSLPLQSFTLQAGLPNFVTGNLALLQTSSDGTMVWQLTGAAGFRYLIERQANATGWEPFTVVTNTTGTATFTDTAASNAQTQFYRARMID
jgi:hypothetical protein